jgi:hypothetical protein
MGIPTHAAATTRRYRMFTTTKFALAAALVLCATLSASAATRVRVMHDHQSAAAPGAIAGYGKDGGSVEVPNPDRQ